MFSFKDWKESTIRLIRVRIFVEYEIVWMFHEGTAY